MLSLIPFLRHYESFSRLPEILCKMAESAVSRAPCVMDPLVSSTESPSCMAHSVERSDSEDAEQKVEESLGDALYPSARLKEIQ